MIAIPECPGPDCLMCSGAACNLCGAGCWNSGAPYCDHASDERHEEPHVSPRWIGPREDELAEDGVSLIAPVPPERWPFCHASEHDRGCKLHRGGLFCDCGASCADDDGVVR